MRRWSFVLGSALMAAAGCHSPCRVASNPCAEPACETDCAPCEPSARPRSVRRVRESTAPCDTIETVRESSAPARTSAPTITSSPPSVEFRGPKDAHVQLRQPGNTHVQTRHGARPEADPAAATVAAAQQEVMLVPRMVYMPFVAQTPQTAMRFTVSQQASAQMVQTQQNFVQPGALVNTATATQSGVNLNATLLEAANNGTLDPRVAAAIREALARPNANVAAPSSTNAEKEAADRIRAATKEIESLNQKLNLLEKALQGLQPNPAPAPTPPGPMSPTAMPMPLPTSSLPPQLGPTLSPGVTLVSPTPIPTRLPNAN